MSSPRRPPNRYRNSMLVQEASGDWVSANAPFVDVSRRNDDRYHLVKAGDRLDGLAQRYLADATLWWIIAEYNDVFWFQDLTVGQTLRVPSFEHLHMDLLI